MPWCFSLRTTKLSYEIGRFNITIRKLNDWLKVCVKGYKTNLVRSQSLNVFVTQDCELKTTVM